MAIASSAAGDEATVKVSFDRDIRPILSENCYACHGFDSGARQADLRLDTRSGAVDEGGVVVPGDSSASALIDRVLTDDADEIMPPPDSGRVLTAAQKETLRRWVDQGAEYEIHWAFVPPTRDPVEPDRDSDRVHPIDRRIQDRLSEAGLDLSPLAPPATLIRRVSLDLVGLPPSVQEIAEFEVAFGRDPDVAYHDLVERLLASPHYGERWGRWWLDQARYADSNGYSVDGPRQIWLYRDWVVDALNADMPFDQFTIQQLAGDLLPDATVSQKVATGFHRNTQINQEGGIDAEQFRIDSIFDRVATTGTVWLGLTTGCAQCHDHKFDPISQKEYYELFAFFNDQDEPSITVYPDDVDADALVAERKKLQQQQQAMVDESVDELSAWETALTESQKKALGKNVQKAIDTDAKKRSLDQKWQLLKSLPSKIESPQAAAIDKRLSQIAKSLATGVRTLVMSERSKPRKTTLMIKGDFTRPSDEVIPGTLDVLHSFKPQSEYPSRLDLARWIVSPQNPLTARVIANRIWQQYFGIGLVETDSDFGLQGTSPTHPELLDWLALELQQNGWSIKDLHRQIVSSHTYRQSSNTRTDLDQMDPLNRLLGRQNRLRLDAEIVRDVALVASGMFSGKMGGPPVYPPIPDGVMNLGQRNRAWHASTGEDRYRRGLYTFVYRVTPPPALNVFDAPDGLNSCTRRIRSNTPLQALTLLNDAGFFELAEALQKIIDEQGLEVAFQRCTSRRPTADELTLLKRLDTLNAARALLNLDETINRE
ncbi:PSD1 and planctomycete cytochrome C domain-containing protein [Rubripirellula lacrimiformis]|nr:PSD1 and planctomycete cytochrome C domain-containing protein [Rubripirellula lacrimiformis]